MNKSEYVFVTKLVTLMFIVSTAVAIFDITFIRPIIDRPTDPLNQQWNETWRCITYDNATYIMSEGFIGCEMACTQLTGDNQTCAEECIQQYPPSGINGTCIEEVKVRVRI